MKLIYLEWEDACSNDNGWLHEHAAINWANEYAFIVRQVGFILKETKTTITLTAGYQDDGEYEPQYHQVLKIPKGWIRKRVDLSKYIKE